MNSSSNLLVLGVTGQVGRLVAKHLKRSKANFSVGSRRKANLEELADQFGASRFIDLDDPRTFDEALKDITGIFLLTGYTVDMLVQSKSLIDAEKHGGKDYFFSADALTPQQVAETLTAATGRKFTAAARDAESFLSDVTQPGSMFERAYAKGGYEFFQYVEDGRMAYVGSVKDDTEKILGREPLLLRDWAKLHADELLEIAGR